MWSCKFWVSGSENFSKVISSVTKEGAKDSGQNSDETEKFVLKILVMTIKTIKPKIRQKTIKKK